MRIHLYLLMGVMTNKGLVFISLLHSSVLAASDGVVPALGSKDNFEKYFCILHSNQISASHTHIIKYGDSIRHIRRVQRDGMIGYVCATGILTNLPTRLVLAGFELKRYWQVVSRLCLVPKIDALDSEVVSSNV